MTNLTRIPFRLAALVILIALPMLRLEAFEIESLDKWSGVFGESKVKFSFRVVADEPLNAMADWTYSANGRIIRRGQAPITNGMIRVELTTPIATDGVVLETDLSVRVASQKADGKMGTQHVSKVSYIPGLTMPQRIG